MKKDGEVINLGYFKCPEEAARAFDKAAKALYGEYCGKLNFEDPRGNVESKKGDLRCHILKPEKKNVGNTL